MKIKFNGQDVEAVEVEFEPEREPFSTYILQDGSRLKVKTVVMSVKRMEGLFDPNGKPAYFIEQTMTTHVDPPDHLRKQD